MEVNKIVTLLERVKEEIPTRRKFTLRVECSGLTYEFKREDLFEIQLLPEAATFEITFNNYDNEVIGIPYDRILNIKVIY